jgi:hypothetical protein
MLLGLQLVPQPFVFDVDDFIEIQGDLIMANISITNLQPAGVALLTDADGFMTDLSDNELTISGGGGCYGGGSGSGSGKSKSKSGKSKSKSGKGRGKSKSGKGGCYCW